MHIEIKSSEILLSLECARLVVFKNIHNEICVCYENCEIKKEAVLEATFGNGKDFETACDSYLTKIRGCKLVFNSTSEKRKEITVLG